ncbi:MAG: hypothetical protein ABJF04_11425 [Reichenbachiella sp.]|uniref:hypothetical protein n=2 Tax=Reichenbachiella sp. TaxID=2184521 RepID=UPI0032677489
MRKYIHIILIVILSVSCQVDNIGPVLDSNIDLIFFMEDGIDVNENSTEPILVEIGSIKGGNSAQLTLGGTAVEGTDYTVTGDLNLSFAEGIYSTSISISLIDNLNPDDDNTIIVSLPEGQGYSENSRREFVVNIINNEVSSGTVVSAISASNDDVEEGATGPLDFDSSDLELGEFDTGGTPDRGLQTIGLRFNGIAIPANVTITSASIQFTTDTPGSGAAELTIYGENVGNATEYIDVDFDVSNRPKTTANAVWAIPEWLAAGDKGAAQKTVDLSAIVQEIVNRADWTADNSINFIMVHTGVSVGVTANDAGREAETFDGSDAPVLTIDWEL